jgi:TnpA family transposase
MPAATFLTTKERERYQGFPDVIENVTLRQYFYLTEDDIAFIAKYHGELNRLAVALQLGIIRYLGYLPISWQNNLHEQVLDWTVSQLNIQSRDIQVENYAKRDKTRTEHLQSILKYLGFRKWQPLIDEPIIEKWLIEQGMEHNHEKFLLDNLCEKLRQDKIFRPAIITLETLVTGIRELLEFETYERLSFLWTNDLIEKLDSLLEVDTYKKMALRRWLCDVPSANTPREMNGMLDKISLLKNMGVADWDLSCLSENRKKHLAQIARKMTNTDLKRFKKIRLYPILVCFLRESLLDITDMVLGMYADYWQQINNKAKKALEVSIQESIKSQQHAIKTMTEVGSMVLDETIDNQLLRDTIYEIVPKTHIQHALQTLKDKQFKNTNHLSFLKQSYAAIKQFTPNLLEKLDFKIAFTKDNFDSALALVKDLQTGKKRKIPQDVPMNFATNNWQKVIFHNEINQQNYEICVLSILKDRLKSGDVYVNLSRKFTNLENLLIEKNYWKNNQEEICKNFSIPDLNKKINQKVEELMTLLPLLSEKLNQAQDIRLENDVLIVSNLNAEDIPSTAKILQEQIHARLPRVSLVDIIQEVDGWVNYSQELENQYVAKNSQHQHLKYAALFSQACNISLADLARSSDLEYQSLWWVTQYYFSDENLKKANNLLVNYHYKQWLSNYWGDGMFSSSDGQRFPTSGKIRNAKTLPKYFGYGQGIGIYTHTADQYSQFGSQIISVHERDATYVLSEILANETDLVLDEHTTDTHGYTDLNFALFDLVGKQFCPRIKDLKSQRLYRIIDKNLPPTTYPKLKFTGSVDIQYLHKHIDEMTRVTASLKMGKVSPTLLISKLQAYPKQNNLMYVLQSYGQLVKTIFICKYLLNQSLRKKINSQLNKGEQLHGLRTYLWFGGDGIIRKKQEHQQQIMAKNLNLLTNIVVLWNTVYIQEIIKKLQSEGFNIDENDFEHVSPAPFEHINRLGKYYFQEDFEPNNKPLRYL